jgi:riboflavin biosynthesis pyrimidine reductase
LQQIFQVLAHIPFFDRLVQHGGAALAEQLLQQHCVDCIVHDVQASAVILAGKFLWRLKLAKKVGKNGQKWAKFKKK